MDGELTNDTAFCPVLPSDALETQARHFFEDLLGFCRQHQGPFRPFETGLLRQLFALGCLLARLFLASLHERWCYIVKSVDVIGKPV